MCSCNICKVEVQSCSLMLFNCNEVNVKILARQPQRHQQLTCSNWYLKQAVVMCHVLECCHCRNLVINQSYVAVGHLSDRLKLQLYSSGLHAGQRLRGCFFYKTSSCCLRFKPDWQQELNHPINWLEKQVHTTRGARRLFATLYDLWLPITPFTGKARLCRSSSLTYLFRD